MTAPADPRPDGGRPDVAPVGGAGAVAPGVTLVEASAGTGKTHRVTSVVVTALADGTPIEQMLLVTFTIKATSELRDRVWRRLHRATEALVAERDARAAGAPPRSDHDDELHAALCDGPLHVLEQRAAHLERARATFDGATIATIHAFCQLVLRTVGFAADVDRDATFVEDGRPLRDEVVRDLLVRKFHRPPAEGEERPDPFPLDRATRVADAAIANPDAPLLPVGRPASTEDGLLVRFAAGVRREVADRKARLRLLGYDDLLHRVADALDDDGTGVRRRLRERFSLVVVDEFQDTDAVQWRILRRAFGGGADEHGGRTRLVLVGDPKQAIYAFRGADVHAYLAAAEEAARPTPLTVNHRSDQALLDALRHLFVDVDLGEGIDHHVVEAAAGGDRRGIDGPRTTPVRLRVVRRDQGLPATRSSGHVQKPAVDAHVSADLAADVRRLLGSRSGVTIRPGDGGEARPVRPRDVAVLVRRNSEAARIRDALVAAGIPAVVNGAGSVFRTRAAEDWILLLRTLDAPSMRTRVRALAATDLLGWTATEIDAADEAAWDRVHERVHRWRDVLQEAGVAALGRAVEDDGLLARTLAADDGARRLTDLRHLTELLHEVAADVGTVPAVLLAWLRDRAREAEEDGSVAGEDRARRLDTDDDAVQVWTVHRSKGQEFPIVYVPFGWAAPKESDTDPLVFQDPAQGRRVVHVGGARLAGADERALARAEVDAEERRLAYVALTRAEHQVVAWWAPCWRSERSALAALLFARSAGPDGLVETPPDDAARTVLDLLAASSGGGIVVEDSRVSPDELPAAREDPEPRPLDRARFRRRLDRDWRRTSYSGLTAQAHDASAGLAGGAPADDGGDLDDDETPVRVPDPRPGGTPVTGEHEIRGLDDERVPDAALAADPALRHEGLDVGVDEAAWRAVPSAFGDLVGGAAFGTLVHEVLEEVDLAAPDLRAALAGALAGRWRAGLDIDDDVLLDGLVAACTTPLGPLADHRPLAGFTRRDRLDELHFELPVAGGDGARPGPGADPEAVPALDLADVADVVARHAGTGPLAGYDEALRDPALAGRTRGYLSGSIDAVLHVDGAHLVVDYKTNRLGTPGEALSAWDHRPSALAGAMARAHYPLQAMIYTVALHRFLRWRIPGYDPDRHLGGVLYLFLRGMAGPGTPAAGGVPAGVFSWRPPTALVLELSDLFDRGRPGGRAGGRR